MTAEERKELQAKNRRGSDEMNLTLRAARETAAAAPVEPDEDWHPPGLEPSPEKMLRLESQRPLDAQDPPIDHHDVSCRGDTGEPSSPDPNTDRPSVSAIDRFSPTAAPNRTPAHRTALERTPAHSVAQVLSASTRLPGTFDGMTEAEVRATALTMTLRQLVEAGRRQNLQIIAVLVSAVDIAWEMAEYLRPSRDREVEEFVDRLDQLRASSRQLITKLCAYEVFVADRLSGPHLWRGPAIVHSKKKAPKGVTTLATVSPIEKFLFTREEAAFSLGLCERTVDYYISRKILITKRHGTKIGITRESIRRCAASDHPGPVAGDKARD